jgi:hypothetical protein
MELIKSTVGFLVKMMVMNILILAFGLTAPLAYLTVPFYLIIKYPGADLTSFATAYTFLGPAAAGFWMLVICHYPAMRRAQRAGNGAQWRANEGGFQKTLPKSFGFMLLGIFGSFAAICGMLALYGMVTPSNYIVYFTIAPFVIFSPVLLTLLVRYLRRDKTEETMPVYSDNALHFASQYARDARHAREKQRVQDTDAAFLRALGVRA